MVSSCGLVKKSFDLNVFAWIWFSTFLHAKNIIFCRLVINQFFHIKFLFCGGKHVSRQVYVIFHPCERLNQKIPKWGSWPLDKRNFSSLSLYLCLTPPVWLLSFSPSSLSDSTVTSDDLLAWLHPFCGDAVLPVRPRIDVLQILESSFSLRDSDVCLLLLYRTQAVLKDREVSHGHDSSAARSQSGSVRDVKFILLEKQL